MEGVERHGLGREEMSDLLKEAGFSQVSVDTAYVQTKEVESGGTQDFPFLICKGKKQ